MMIEKHHRAVHLEYTLMKVGKKINKQIHFFMG